MNQKHYTTSQAAKLLSVSADTVLKWVKAGKINSYRTPGGHYRIPADAVETLLPARSPGSCPGPSRQGLRLLLEFLRRQ